MRDIVSVIIPSKNSERTLEKCLKSIQRQTYKNLKIIVVDNNSTDKTKKIVEDFRLKSKETRIGLYNKGPERSAQRNYGAQKSGGEYLLFIDSDMELDNRVVEECVKQAREFKNRLGGVIIPEKSFGISFWAKCKALERSFYLGIDWIEAPRFFSKKTFLEFKGYDLNQTGTEDYDLPQRIKAKYGNESVVRINSFINHNEGDLALGYALKKKFYYVKTANKYLENNSEYFRKQANPINRYKIYFSDPKKLFRNPVIGIGMLFMKTTEFIVGAIGYLNSEK